VANKHEIIAWKIVSDWTADNRGRLYFCRYGLAFPAQNGPDGVKPADNPIWFGPLKRNFKGFPDLFGFEWDILYQTHKHLNTEISAFTTLEVKTKNDRIRPDQRRVMNQLATMGVRCYVGWEDDGEERGYRIERLEI
jgi:hypothetical protein